MAQGRDGEPVGPDGGLPSLRAIGFGDLRIAPKLQFLREDKHTIAMSISPTVVIPLGPPKNYFRSRSVVFQPELAVSKAFKRHRLSANVGYRVEQSTEFLSLVIDDEVFYHLGYGYRLKDIPLELDATLSGGFLAKQGFKSSTEIPLEVRGGPVYDVSDKVALIGLFGAGLTRGYGTPTWRGVFAVKVHGDTERDRDGDGYVNGVDDCPDRPENFNGLEDEDGCPDVWPDTDHDGFLDRDDQCIDEPENFNQHLDNDGCPDEWPDTDDDGILDKDDECPVVEGVEAYRGCPIPVKPGETLYLTDQIEFKFDRDQLQKTSYRILDVIYEKLVSHPEVTLIEVQGHTDSVGYQWYNKSLSQRRAASVRAYLIKKGIPAARLKAQGYGESKPIADNKTKAGQASNRRVQFIALDVDKSRARKKGLTVIDSKAITDSKDPKVNQAEAERAESDNPPPPPPAAAATANPNKAEGL